MPPVPSRLVWVLLAAPRSEDSLWRCDAPGATHLLLGLHARGRCGNVCTDINVDVVTDISHFNIHGGELLWVWFNGRRGASMNTDAGAAGDPGPLQYTGSAIT